MLLYHLAIAQCSMDVAVLSKQPSVFGQTFAQSMCVCICMCLHVCLKTRQWGDVFEFTRSPTVPGLLLSPQMQCVSGGYTYKGVCVFLCVCVCVCVCFCVCVFLCVQLPLDTSETINTDRILNVISPAKDVDG